LRAQAASRRRQQSRQGEVAGERARG